jgi:hypothetical protein
MKYIIVWIKFHLALENIKNISVPEVLARRIVAEIFL